MVFLLVLSIFLKTSQFTRSYADCRTAIFLPEVKQDQALFYHVIVNISVDVEDLCKVQCYLNNDCMSYNIGPPSTNGMMLCQLNNANIHQYPLDLKKDNGFTYTGSEDKCKNDNCPQNSICHNDVGRHGYRCVCLKGFNGSRCENEILHKIKVNIQPVCIGAKNDSFGVFKSTVHGAVKAYQMVHISGGISWGGTLKWRGKWGDLYDKHIELHITNSKNKRLAPPLNYPMAVQSSLRYDLPGQSHDAQSITLPEFKPRLMVSKNEEFRIWFGEDLLDYDEADNHGSTCKDVYMVYREV